MMNLRSILAVATLLILTLVAQISPMSAQATAPTATVTVARLNVRAAPSNSAPVVTVISRGDVYPVLDSDSSLSWWQIDAHGTVGWVAARYVHISSVDAPAATPEPTAEPTSAPECSGDALFFPADPATYCATGPAIHTQASYEAFERGFMIWLASSGDVYVFSNRGVTLVPDEIYGNFPTPAPQTPPPGLQMPVSGFARVWGNLSWARADLGWAFAPESGYVTVAQPGQPAQGGAALTFLMRPDGGVIAIDLAHSLWYTAH